MNYAKLVASKIVEATKYVVSNKNQLASTSVQMIRTAHAAASNPDKVVTAVIKTVSKRTGVSIEQSEAEFLGKMFVKKIRTRG